MLRVLQALSNPIRRAAIQALKDGEKRFSRLMWACGLNPNFNAGHFCYHLSQLISKGIVSNHDAGYSLTRLGLELSNFLDSVQTEFALSFAEQKERIRGKKMFKVKKLEDTDLEQLVLMKYGVLKEEAEGVLQDYMESERFWVYGKKDPFEDGRNRTLIAMDSGKIVGAIYGSKGGAIPIPKGTKGAEKAREGGMYLHKLTKEERKREIPTAKIYDIWIDPTYYEVGLEEDLTEAFVEQAQSEKCTKVTAWQIPSSREDLPKALKTVGFRRVEAHYILSKGIT